MRRNLTFAIAIALIASASSFVIGCGDLQTACDPETYSGDGTCVCDDPNDEATCYVEEGSENNDDTNNNNNTNGNTNNETTDINDDPDPTPPSYRYVLLEDLTNETMGRTAGADIDAVSIDKGDVEFYATVVEDFNTGGAGNEFMNPEEALGAPDSGCEIQNFFSMGGEANDGFLMLSFGTDDEDVTIEDGDEIVVYELGPQVCPNQPTWVTDDVRVSISTSDERVTFVEIGQVTTGQNIIPVTLP